MNSAVLSLLAKTLPPPAIGLGRTRTALREIGRIGDTIPIYRFLFYFGLQGLYFLSYHLVSCSILGLNLFLHNSASLSLLAEHLPTRRHRPRGLTRAVLCNQYLGRSFTQIKEMEMHLYSIRLTFVPDN